eukprot:TRINITY_DN64770_c0_g1_i1.p2 TRINITY_DN64770_c0_g1~~TRINITY_DN64770_c0_g1_i1.p2  ORF type:complete len:105 (+),score=35.12 TRINITY_DN64770_c0_g1_i1:89-403(+)
MAEIEKIPGFEAAAKASAESKVSTTFEQRSRGYGLYKVATLGVPPKDEDCPSVVNVMQVERRQKWFAHEAAWKETGGDPKKAQELYIKFTEEVNGLEPGHFSKQ